MLLFFVGIFGLLLAGPPVMANTITTITTRKAINVKKIANITSSLISHLP